jgi:VWFA-related protein
VSAQLDSVFRSETVLIHVDAEAVDRGGRILDKLTQRDFHVFDQGQEQRIEKLLREEQPLDLILLFDISGSMRPIVQAVAQAAERGMHDLRPGDRVSVRVFNTKSQVVLPFTNDLASVAAAIQGVAAMRFRGGTLIQRAVDEAALAFEGDDSKQRRRAVLIITDNIGTRTRREESVVKDFWQADAILSGLIVQDPKFRTAHVIADVIAPQIILLETGMKGIAEKTGGDVLQSEHAGDSFAEALRRIRTRYSIYYRMPADAREGQKRRINVRLSPELGQVKARRGYVAP